MKGILVSIIISALKRLIGSKDLVEQLKMLVLSAFTFDGDGAAKRADVMKKLAAIGGTLGAVVAATAPMLLSAMLEMLVLKYKPVDDE